MTKKELLFELYELNDRLDSIVGELSDIYERIQNITETLQKKIKEAGND